jgi:hypothetical protein
MITSIEALKLGLFQVIHHTSEKQDFPGKGTTSSVLSRHVMLLVDAGQVTRVLFLTEFGWKSEVETFARKFDIIGLTFDLVRIFFRSVTLIKG